MFIQTQSTESANRLIFLPGRDVLPGSAATFSDRGEATRSPLAEQLFAIDGIARVVFDPLTVVVDKLDDYEWHQLKPQILTAIMDHYTSGRDLFYAVDSEAIKAGDEEQALESEIRELIDTRIYPAVAQGGGHIAFHSYREGVVLLEMSGAAFALKDRIEMMLQHYVPEVQAVKDFRDALPKPGLETSTGIDVQRVLAERVNPAVASHGGYIALVDVQDDTAYIRLEGGCQGCGMADVTLKQGVEREILQAVPEITRVLDVTDHAGGTNPYYQPGKGGMSPY